MSSRFAATDGGASRFALLEHHHPLPGWPTPHFDLLVEDPELIPGQGAGERRCRTWRLRADPRDAPAVPAVALPPHRAFYLDHEGEVSGGRGAVARLDGGAAAWESRDPAAVVLYGSRLSGRWALPTGEGWMRSCEPRPKGARRGRTGTLPSAAAGCSVKR